MKRVSGTFILAGALACFLAPSSAAALDLPKIDKIPLKLDVTELSYLVQRFDPRDKEAAGDGSFGYWMNRLNITLTWWRFTVGTRLDSSVWWREPHDVMPQGAPGTPQYVPQQTQAIADSYRFPQTIYPAKIWLTYNAPGVEITLGDSYVQFARGLLLSMRKLDDLGIDNTVRGAKVAITKGAFSFTGVGGLANPSRVDEATGQTLFLQRLPEVTSDFTDAHDPHPVFGSDRLIGAEIQAGRGLPITLSTSAVRFTRCAPYAYDANGKIIDKGIFASEIGTCDDGAVKQWISSLTDQAPARQATQIDMVAQTVEVPKIGPLGSIYVTGAVQRRTYDYAPDRNGAAAEGNAIYGSYSGTFGRMSNTFEFKSYRNFRPVVAGINVANSSAFSYVAYSNPPTTEVLTQDNLGTNDFNACATGGRLRSDIRFNKHFLAYFQGIYEVSKTEQSGTSCDKYGHIVGQFANTPDQATDNVWDATAGIQLDWDRSRSFLYALVNTRNDVRGDGQPYLRQDDFEYTFSAYLGKSIAKLFRGPTSVELTGRNRLRYEADENFAPGGQALRWFEGENYLGLKVAPKWVFSAGLEYTTKVALPTWYPNGSIQYKFTSGSNIKLFVGDQRGGLKCVSGVCRIFPAFEGARLELTLRF